MFFVAILSPNTKVLPLARLLVYSLTDCARERRGGGSAGRVVIRFTRGTYKAIFDSFLAKNTPKPSNFSPLAPSAPAKHLTYFLSGGARKNRAFLRLCVWRNPVVGTRTTECITQCALTHTHTHTIPHDAVVNIWSADKKQPFLCAPARCSPLPANSGNG